VVKPARGRTARAWSLGLGIVVLVSGLAALGAWRLSGSSAKAAHSTLGLFVGSERPSAIEALAATLGVTAR
jgi:hypothetical protein